MKIPESPPDYIEILSNIFKSDEKKAKELIIFPAPTDKKGRYLHWEEIKNRTPKKYKPEEWWAGVKFARQKTLKKAPFKAKTGKPFYYSLTDYILKEVHWFDQNASGNISTESLIPSTSEKKGYLIRSYINEAISSSQLEGAAVTRKKAKQMLRDGRKPDTVDEKMIFNNYQAMQYILEKRGESLTPKILLKLHGILTIDTLENPKAVGKFRASDDIFVIDPSDNTELHIPPKASELRERINALCDFANDKESLYFLHPVVRAIILHFMLSYIHPFEDGNGRVARALFYWHTVHNGYWLMEYISISSIIKKAPIKYGKAFLYTETDENDLTYFVIHQIGVIRKAIDGFFAYLEKSINERKYALQSLQTIPRLQYMLNCRQINLLRHALNNPDYIYTISAHKNTHNIVYETSRRDLFDMSDKLGLLEKSKSGRTYIFVSPPDLSSRIKRFK